MSELENVTAALTADGAEVDALVADLAAEDWQRETPAPGWTIAHQVAHLTAVFRMAGTAAADPDKFRTIIEQIGDDFTAAVEADLAKYVDLPPAELLARWQSQRAETVTALAAAPPEKVLPWLVNPLPPAVLGCAGLMELFGHGQDIADTVGVRPARTDRLLPLVTFGVRTRDFGYQARKLTPPPEEFRFELTAPSGALWAFGPEDGEQRIAGPAEDFCLLVTRRRHRDDLALTATGELAEGWLDVAQAYRGPAGEGRRPGQFAPALS